jgi:carboxyl-terminal processing protease
MASKKTGYIRLTDFNETTACRPGDPADCEKELEKALRTLTQQGATSMILDIRDNPGGLLDQAFAVSNLFLKKGQMVVFTRGRTKRDETSYVTEEESKFAAVPLIVLTSKHSASASEIVAGAIQDHDRGLIVGQRTWGKGLVQSVYTLPYGAGLALTTAKYYTPSGRWIQRDYSDLLAYVNPDDHDGTGDDTTTTTEPPRKEGEVFYTDAGRVVYAAGGITPDVVVKNNRDSKLLTQLLARNLPFNFAVNWLVKHPDVSRDVAVTPAMRDEFFKFAETAKFSTADELRKTWNDDPNHDLVDLAIRVELVNAKYGLEAGWGVRATGDAQVQKALTLFGEAERIAALPKKKNPARAAKN